MKTQRIALGLWRYLRGSACCLFLAGGGFLLRRNRPLLDVLSDHFSETQPPDSAVQRPVAKVPSVTPEELLGESAAVTLTELTQSDGNVSTLELVVIAGLVRRVDPRRSLEIGTFDGRTTLNIALNQRPGSEVVTLDLPPAGLATAARPVESSERKYIEKESSGARFSGRRSPARIIQVYGDSATYDFSRYAGAVDFMFVDGSHSYEYARSDSQLALTLVSQGGLLVWHDYDTPYWPGVTRALNELYAEVPDFRNLKHVCGTSLCVLTQ